MIIKKPGQAGSGSSNFERLKAERQARLRERAEAVGSRPGMNFDSYIDKKFTLYKIRTGDNMFRVAWDMERFEGDDSREIWTYESIGPDRGNYLTTNPYEPSTWNDPIAELHKEVYAKYGKDHPLNKLTWPRHRVVFQGFDRHREPQSKDLLILNAPFSKLGANIILLCRNPEFPSSPYDFSDPDEGFIVMFTRGTEGKFTTADGKEVDAPTYQGIQLGRTINKLSAEERRQIVPFEEILVQPDMDKLEEIAQALRAKYLGGPMPERRQAEEEAPEEQTESVPWDEQDSGAQQETKKTFKIKLKRR